MLFIRKVYCFEVCSDDDNNVLILLNTHTYPLLCISPMIYQMELQHGDVLARIVILSTQLRLESASGVQYYK